MEDSSHREMLLQVMLFSFQCTFSVAYNVRRKGTEKKTQIETKSLKLSSE